MKIIKCPRCNSTARTSVSNRLSECNQCGNRYHSDLDNNDSLFIMSPDDSKAKNKWLVTIILLALAVVIIVVGSNMFNRQNSDELNDEYIGKTLNSTPSTYARTAFVLYQDKTDNHSYLFRADFLTASNDQNDKQVVSIKQEQGKLVAYDTLSQNLIPNFNQLISTPLSLDAAVLYSDIDYVIIKKRINDDYQLDMLNAFTGDVIWTLSGKEVLGIENLSERYLADENKGIKKVKDGFMINLPPNYYLIDENGHLIDFGGLQ